VGSTLLGLDFVSRIQDHLFQSRRRSSFGNGRHASSTKPTACLAIGKHERITFFMHVLFHRNCCASRRTSRLCDTRCWRKLGCMKGTRPQARGHLARETKRMGIPPISVIYPSPFLRCRQTAIAALHGVNAACVSGSSGIPPVRVEHDLAESINED
jgi:hypothetical protein